MNKKYNEFLRKKILKAIPSKFKTQTELAEAVGMTQGNISLFLSGKRGLTFDIGCNILEVLGISFQEQDSLKIEQTEESKPITLPLYILSEKDSDYSSLEINGFIDIFPHYYSENIKVIKVADDTREPLIKKDSHIGIIPFDCLIEGKIYLISRPPFALSLRRIYQDSGKQIILKSDNKSEQDIIISSKNYQDLIIGRVIWAWQYM